MGKPWNKRGGVRQMNEATFILGVLLLIIGVLTLLVGFGANIPVFSATLGNIGLAGEEMPIGAIFTIIGFALITLAQVASNKRR